MVDWAQFNVKNEGKESVAFEEMIYLLFCTKYGRKEGISGYFNQRGIEKEPIKVNDECIGFQAKFYETKLSDNTPDLKKSIRLAKRDYPNITKIEFYINKEYGQGHKNANNKPVEQDKVEKYAKENGIKIDWYFKGQLDVILFQPENQKIHDKFFGNEKSFLDYIEELNIYSNSLFENIKDNLTLNDNVIKINRDSYINELDEKISENDCLLINGNPGCGKSALAKEFLKQKDCPVLMFKPDDFDVDNIQFFFNRFNLSLNDFREFFKDYDEKFILIDSTELIGTLKNQIVINEFLKLMIQDSWKIIFTSRINYSNSLKLNLKVNFKFKVDGINLKELSIEELNKLFEENNLKLPNNFKFKNSLQNLFYLNAYLSNIDNIDLDNENEIKDVLWDLIIKKSHYEYGNAPNKREECFLKFIEKRSINPYFKFDIDSTCQEILNDFQREGIISDISDRYHFCHDIYEDWGMDRIINKNFNESNGNYEIFIKRINDSIKFKVGYRKWLLYHLNNNYESIVEFLDFVILDGQCEESWIDETIFAVMISNKFELFLKKYKFQIVTDNYILKRILYWLQTIFRKESDSKFSKLIKEHTNNIIYKPYGDYWEKVISFLYDNLEKWNKSQMEIIVPYLLNWNQHYSKGNTTRTSSLIGLKFYENLEENEYYNMDKLKNDCISIVLLGSKEIKNELGDILNKVVLNNWKKSQNPYYMLSTRILSMENYGHICEVLPNEILKLAHLFWICNDESKYYFSEYEESFLVDQNTTSRYFYESPFETPILYLLMYNPEKTVDFIINFVNTSIIHHVENYPVEKDDFYRINEIELEIEGIKNKQYISNSLWQCYRGSGYPVIPTLLKIMHMALEKFLLEECENDNFGDVEKILKTVLLKSKSASLTAVVTSVVLAYPDNFFDIALILFKTLDLFMYDNVRWTQESEAKSLYTIAPINRRFLIQERLDTCNQEFRKMNLEGLIINYQYFRNENIPEEISKCRVETIQKLLDIHMENLNSENITQETLLNYKRLLSRIDRRNLKPIVQETNDGVQIAFENVNEDDDLKEDSENFFNELNYIFKYVDLSKWADAKIDNKPIPKNLLKYDKDINNVLNELNQFIIDLNKNNLKLNIYVDNLPVRVSFCLLKFYSDSLNDDDKDFCKNIIIENICVPLFYENYFYQTSDRLDIGVSTLVYLFDLFPEDRLDLMVILLLILFNDAKIDASNYFSSFSIIALRKLYVQHPNYVNNILCCYSKFKQDFDDVYSKIIKENRNSNINNLFAWAVEKFLDKYEAELEHINDYNEFNFESLNLISANVIFQTIPENSKDELHLELFKFVFQLFANDLFDNDSQLNSSKYYFVRYVFLMRFCNVTLMNKSNLKEYISPFLNQFRISEGTYELFNAFVNVVRNEVIVEFWDIWWIFLEKILENHENIGKYYLEKVLNKFVINYQLENDFDLSEDIIEIEKQFYRRVCNELGKYEFILNSISKIVIKNKFILSGLTWIKIILGKNDFNDIEKGTISNLEHFVKKYVSLNSENIMKDIKIQNDLSLILDFLIKNGSNDAFMLNEWVVSLK